MPAVKEQCQSVFHRLTALIRDSYASLRENIAIDLHVIAQILHTSTRLFFFTTEFLSPSFFFKIISFSLLYGQYFHHAFMIIFIVLTFKQRGISPPFLSFTEKISFALTAQFLNPNICFTTMSKGTCAVQ